MFWKSLRKTVKEVTLDLVAIMEHIASRSFPKSRFHVQQLASDAVQQLRIEYFFKTDKSDF